MQYLNLENSMEIRQQSTAIESHSECKSSGKLAEMDQILFEWIKDRKRPLSANQIYKDFDGMFLLPSITASINRLRYTHCLIKGSKVELPHQRKKTYYSVLKEGEQPDKRPLSESDKMELLCFSLIKTNKKYALEIKQLKAKIEMLTKNFVINK
jgi:hypothetical protein